MARVRGRLGGLRADRGDVTKYRTTVEVVVNNFNALADEVQLEVDRLCQAMAFTAMGEARMLIRNPPKTGRIYMKGKNRDIAHQASAPEEAPATDTGALADNSLIRRRGLADYEIQFNQKYAAPLEFGTPTILPRPFLRPAVEAYRASFERHLRDILAGL